MALYHQPESLPSVKKGSAIGSGCRILYCRHLQEVAKTDPSCCNCFNALAIKSSQKRSSPGILALGTVYIEASLIKKRMVCCIVCPEDESVECYLSEVVSAGCLGC